MEEFIHPENISPFEKMKQPSLLKLLLRSQRVKKIKNQPQYKILKSGENKIAAKCKQENCPAFVKLIKVEDYYTINKKNTKHVHQREKSLQDTKISGFKISASVSSKAVKQSIRKIIAKQEQFQKEKQDTKMEMPQKESQDIKIEAIQKAKSTSKIQIPQKQKQQKEEIESANPKSKLSEQTILNRNQSDLDAFLIYLQKKGFKYRYKKNEEINSQVPAFLLFANDQMIREFDHYGSFCSVYVDKTIKLNFFTIANGDKMNLRLMIFSGINAGFHVIDFAYAIVEFNNSKNITALFQQLLKFMGSRPDTFIIQESQEKVVKVLEKIEAKYPKISFIFDSEETAKQIKKQQAKFKIKQVDIGICEKIVKSKDLKQYEYYIQLAIKNFQNSSDKKQGKLLTRLLSKSKRICFSQFKDDRISGYQNIEFSINCSIRNLIQRIFKNYKNYKTVSYSQIINISVNLIHQELNRKKRIFLSQEVRFQHIFQIPELKYLRVLLERSIFRKLVLMIGECFSISGNLISLNQGIVQVNQRGTLAIFRVTKKELRWQCECKYSNKEGLPCIHEVKICVLSGSTLTYQIHKRWMRLQIYQMQKNNQIVVEDQIRQYTQHKDWLSLQQ